MALKEVRSVASARTWMLFMEQLSRRQGISNDTKRAHLQVAERDRRKVAAMTGKR